MRADMARRATTNRVLQSRIGGKLWHPRAPVRLIKKFTHAQAGTARTTAVGPWLGDDCLFVFFPRFYRAFTADA